MVYYGSKATLVEGFLFKGLDFNDHADSIKQCIYKIQMKELGSYILRFLYVPTIWNW
jgi:hypothetical protein